MTMAGLLRPVVVAVAVAVAAAVLVLVPVPVGVVAVAESRVSSGTRALIPYHLACPPVHQLRSPTPPSRPPTSRWSSTSRP